MRIAVSFGSGEERFDEAVAGDGLRRRQSLRAERRQAVLDKQRGDRGALFGDRLRCLELVDLLSKPLDFGGLLACDEFVRSSTFQVQVVEWAESARPMADSPRFVAALDAHVAWPASTGGRPWAFALLRPRDSTSWHSSAVFKQSARRGGVGDEVDALHREDFFDDRLRRRAWRCGPARCARSRRSRARARRPRGAARPARAWG